jgi:hypothetical protein
MPKNVEVLLKRVQVGENGEDGITTATTLLSISLTYPNVLTPTRSTVKALKLTDNTDIDFSVDLNPDTGRPYSYSDRIVFKETIQGNTSLIVGMATVHKTAKLDKFLAGFFGAVFAGAWKLLLGGITNVIAGAAVENVAATHVKSFEIEDEKSNPIGEGVVEFNESSLPASPVTVALTAPDDLTVEKFQLMPGSGQPKRVKVKLLTKGQANGVVELELRTL